MRRWVGTHAQDPFHVEKFDRQMYELESAITLLGKGRQPIAGGGTILTLGRVIRHGELLGLDADDHLQYLHLPGRAGDGVMALQTAYGGTSAFPSTNQLVLQASPSPIAPAGVARLVLWDYHSGLALPAVQHRAGVHQWFSSNGANEGARLTTSTSAGRLQIFGACEVWGAASNPTSYILQAGVGGSYTNLVALKICRGTSGQTSHLLDFVSQDNSTVLSFFAADGTFNGPVSGAITPSTLTVDDNALTIRDGASTTRTFQFSANGITAGQNRIITVRDSNLTMAGTDVANTFSADQEVGSGSALILNLAGQGSYPSSDGVLFKNSGFTAELNADLSADRQISLPDGDGVLLNETTVQSMTGKTLGAGTGTSRNILTTGATSGILLLKPSTSVGVQLVVSAVTATRSLTYPCDQAVTLGGMIGTAYTSASQNGSLTAATIATPTDAGLYRVVWYIAASAATAATLDTTLSWTDANGGQTKATGATAITANGYLEGSATIYSAAGQVVQIATTFAGTSITYVARAKVMV